MNSTLQQINISYVATEDRLLLKVRANDSAEFRLWLTRRYTRLLIEVLNEQVNKEGGMQELASNSKTLGLLRSGAFEQAYESQPGQNYPLGETGVLGFRINVSRKETGIVNLQLLPEEGQGLNVALDKAMLYLLFNLLEQGLVHTDWGIHVPQPDHQSVH